MDLKVGFFFPPTIGAKRELQRGMAGQSTPLYQSMLRNLVDIVSYIDAHGYYGIGFTEHHLSVEGITASGNPAMLCQYFVPHTRNINLGPLGYVLPANDPLRVAVEIAMLDQFSEGRAFAGLVRGIQTRWLNIMGQHRGLADNISDPAAYEARKRDLYDESVEIIIKAWTHDTFSHEGPFWKIPGNRINWPAAGMSREMGGGVDENNNLVEVGLCPQTYERRLPTMFEPFSVRAASIEAATSRGIIPIGIMSHRDFVVEQLNAAERGWASKGINRQRGSGIGFGRYMVVADTDAEAMEIAKDALWEWIYFFTMFGFNLAMAAPGENYKRVTESAAEFIERGMLFCGSPDTVCRQLEAYQKYCPAEYLWLFTGNELVPKRQMMRSLELMTTKVFPHFSSTIR